MSAPRQKEMEQRLPKVAKPRFRNRIKAAWMILRYGFLMSSWAWDGETLDVQYVIAGKYRTDWPL